MLERSPKRYNQTVEGLKVTLIGSGRLRLVNCYNQTVEGLKVPPRSLVNFTGKALQSDRRGIESFHARNHFDYYFQLQSDRRGIESRYLLYYYVFPCQVTIRPSRD